MEFSIKAPHAGNEKPIMQHVVGDVLTEWHVGRDQNTVVRSRGPLAVPLKGPSAGTFFLGGMETSRDELADYLEEAVERNAAATKPDRMPEIQQKINRTRERHGAAIEAAVEWQQKGYQLPKQTPRQRRALLVPTAVAVEGPNGKLQVIGVRNGRG